MEDHSENLREDQFPNKNHIFDSNIQPLPAIQRIPEELKVKETDLKMIEVKDQRDA
jgi:hypothetical protein